MVFAIRHHPTVVIKYNSPTSHLVIIIIIRVTIVDGIHGGLDLSLLLLLQDAILLDDMVNLGFVHLPLLFK